MGRENKIKTIPWLLKHRVNKTPNDIAYMEKNATGVWQKITWKQFYDQVVSLATGFMTYQLEPEDQIAILLPNCVMWEVAQQAAYQVGCVVVGLDRNDPVERVRQIIELTDIKAVVVQNIDQLETLPLEWLRTMKLILSVDNLKVSQKFVQAVGIDLLMVSADEKQLPSINGSHPATVIFTSGTTGLPKAIPYNHDQVLAAVSAITRLLSKIPDQASSACWLPLSNPFQRISNLCAIQQNWQAYMVSEPAKIITESQKIKPYFFTAVPRFYEKVYEGIEEKINAMPLISRQLMRMALRVGTTYQHLKQAGSPFVVIFKIPNQIADFLFFKKIRQLLGGNVHYFISGSAPMSLGLLVRFRAMGWLILESYGVSENIVPMSMNILDEYRLGTVGKPLIENNIKIAPDGEVCVCGIGVARKGIDQQDVNLTQDGYLRTGDLGEIDADGYLVLSGRKSDGFKLSTGRKITPSIIESALKQIVEVTHAVIDGANQKYVVALLNIENEKWGDLMRRFQTKEEIRTYLEKEMTMVCKKLPRYCRPVDFEVIQAPFAVETGELTVNLKLRRKHILHHHRKTILNLYQKKHKINSIVLDTIN